MYLLSQSECVGVPLVDAAVGRRLLGHDLGQLVLVHAPLSCVGKMKRPFIFDVFELVIPFTLSPSVSENLLNLLFYASLRTRTLAFPAFPSTTYCGTSYV